MDDLISLLVFLVAVIVGYVMTRKPKQPEGRYDRMESCNACGGQNDITVTDRIDYMVCEAETVCEDCGHKDHWAYGHFESGRYMVSKCRKYG